MFHLLSIKAAASGTNLKKYIENLLEHDVQDVGDAAKYQYLLENRPEGNVALDEKETNDFENWLD